MPEVGLRELKTRASEILRDVREHRQRYVVTHRGRPVALLVPVAEIPSGGESADDSGQDGWDDFLRLADEIGRKWQGPPTVQEVLDDMRR
jgi:prevent-host-death family protein